MGTIHWEAEREAAILQKHAATAQQVRNAIKSGLSAQDILDGVRLSHEEYLDLVRRALDRADRMFDDAANEIERLTRENGKLRAALRVNGLRAGFSHAEIDAALAEIESPIGRA